MTACRFCNELADSHKAIHIEFEPKAVMVKCVDVYKSVRVRWFESWEQFWEFEGEKESVGEG